MIHFQCPRCDTTYAVPDACAGKKTSCRRCNQRLKVPGDRVRRTILGRLLPDPSMPAPFPVAEQTMAEARLTSPARSPRRRAFWGVVVTVSAVLAFAGALLVIAVVQAGGRMPVSLRHPEAIDADALCKEFDENPVAAVKRHDNKKITVVGEVGFIAHGDAGVNPGIVCTFAKEKRDQVERLRKGRRATIRGKFVMFQPPLGGVILIDCELLD